MKKARLLIVFALLSCSKIVEPVTFGEYFVSNQTSKTIILSALGIGGQEVTLHASSLSTGEKSHIYSVAEGTGGHVMPSNSFSSFTVYSESKTAANIIYSKVENSDWIYEGTDGQGHLVYHLTIK